MERFSVYLKLECKRILRLFPGILIVTFLVLAVCGVFLLKDVKNGMNTKKELKTMNIGIVYSEEDEQFLGLGFYMLEHADGIGYVCKFREVTLEDGERLLEDEEIDVLAIFPDDYVKSVYYGIETPISLRFGTAQSGISSLMFSQLAKTISSYMMESKAGVYTMQDMYSSWGLRYFHDADRLAEKYVLRILARDGMLDHQSVDATEGMSITMYYICVGVVLVLLFWGLNCGSVLGKNKKMLGVLLERQKLSKLSQYFAKYLSVLLLFFLNYVVIASVAIVVTWKMQIDVVTVFTYVKMLPVLLLLCALVLCVYEISNDGIGGMLFFFFATVIMGFLSGFFYPLSYFPVWMQGLAKWLPTRIMFDYIAGCINDNFSLDMFLKLAIYTVIFVVITNVFSNESSRIVLGRKKSRRMSR